MPIEQLPSHNHQPTPAQTKSEVPLTPQEALLSPKASFDIKSLLFAFPPMLDASLISGSSTINRYLPSADAIKDTQARIVFREKTEAEQMIGQDYGKLGTWWKKVAAIELDKTKLPQTHLTNFFETLYTKPEVANSLNKLLSELRTRTSRNDSELSEFLLRSIRFFGGESRAFNQKITLDPLETHIYNLEVLGNNPFFIGALANMFLLSHLRDEQRKVTDGHKKERNEANEKAKNLRWDHNEARLGAFIIQTLHKGSLIARSPNAPKLGVAGYKAEIHKRGVRADLDIQNSHVADRSKELNSIKTENILRQTINLQIESYHEVINEIQDFISTVREGSFTDTPEEFAEVISHIRYVEGPSYVTKIRERLETIRQDRKLVLVK